MMRSTGAAVGIRVALECAQRMRKFRRCEVGDIDGAILIWDSIPGDWIEYIPDPMAFHTVVDGIHCPFK
jgi:hypothetical protein